MRTRRRAASVAVALALAAGLPARAQAPPTQGSERDAAVQAVLDQREEAIRNGDRERFLDTVDPGAAPGFRRAQERLFTGLRSIPLARYELILRTDEAPDLSIGLGDRYAADAVFLPPVEGRYRIDGADSIDAVDGYFYTFLLREGRWRIVSDTDIEDLGLPSARNLWDFGPVARSTSDHFTMLFDPGDRERAEGLLSLAEEAYGRLEAGFGRPVPEQVVMVLPHNLDQLRDMLQATFDLTNFVAFATSSVDRDEGWASTSPRVYVQDTNLSRGQRAFQLETLHHELIHVAAFPLAGPFVPVWVHEGVADWMATGRDGPSAVTGSDNVLPDDFEFTTGGPTKIVSAYAESVSAAAFLAQVKGQASPLDLLVETGRPRVAPGTSDYHLDQATRTVFGQGFSEFQKAWDGGR